MTERRSVRRSPRGEERRREIVEVAFQRFANGGFHAVSFADIADAVGLTLPGLIHYFPTKSDLLLAVLQHREEMAEAYVWNSQNTGLDLIDALVDVVAANALQPAIAQLFTVVGAESISTDHPAHEWFTDRYRRIIRRLTTAITEAQESGDVHADVDASQAAHWIIAAADGLRLQWLLNPDHVDHVALLRQFVSMMHTYLTGRPRATFSTPSSEWELGGSTSRPAR